MKTSKSMQDLNNGDNIANGAVGPLAGHHAIGRTCGTAPFAASARSTVEPTVETRVIRPSHPNWGKQPVLPDVDSPIVPLPFKSKLSFFSTGIQAVDAQRQFSMPRNGGRCGAATGGGSSSPGFRETPCHQHDDRFRGGTRHVTVPACHEELGGIDLQQVKGPALQLRRLREHRKAVVGSGRNRRLVRIGARRRRMCHSTWQASMQRNTCVRT